MYGLELASHTNEYPCSMHRRPTLNTAGVDGNANASDTEFKAATCIRAADSTATGPLAVERDTVVFGEATAKDDESAMDCGAKSWPLPVSITQDVPVAEA